MILVSHTFCYFWYKLTNFYYHLGVYFRYFIIVVLQSTNQIFRENEQVLSNNSYT